MITNHRALRTGALWVLAVAAALLLATTAWGAERAWVKDEVRINIRSGPGVQFRIRKALKTGDLVEILDRAEGWTQVRVDGHDVGWIPAGYLQAEEPARVLLAKREEEALVLQKQLDDVSESAEDLREENGSLASRDSGQRAEIERLAQENMKLRAGSRWPEWIAGAGLLSAGMILGAILHRNSTRRPTPRIRL